MGLYYRKRVKLFKGLNVNFSKSGPSISIGPRGAKLNFSKRGVYASASIPGTGIYMRQKIAGRKINKQRLYADEERRRLRKEAEKKAVERNPIGFFFGFLFMLFGFWGPLFTDMSWWWCPILFITGILTIAIGAFIPRAERLDDAENTSLVEATNCHPEEQEAKEIGNTVAVSTDSENAGTSIVCTNSNKNPTIIKNADPLFKDAARFIINEDLATISKLQRHFQIGYVRSCKIMEQLECAGIVGVSSGAAPRQILINGGIEQLLDEIQLEEEAPTSEEQILVRRAAIRAEVESQKSKEECEFENKNKKARDIISLAGNEEKKGMIKEAIAHYEEIVSLEIPVNLPYERLPILYRRFKNYEDEIRVLNTAIKVFTKENERRATFAIKLGYIDFTTAMQALEINESIRDERGLVLLSLYDINKYCDRLAKARNLLNKNN